MKKKILIITPFFAPETHAAVFRAHKLAKYLNKENWEVHVLTVDTNYLYNEDEDLLNELKGVTIHRSRYVEPTLRGLKMWLTGKDSTFKTLKEQGFYKGSQQENNTVKDKISWKSKIYNYILNNYLRKPDRFWTWENGAIKKASCLIKEYNITSVYTTMPPFTAGKIGLKIKKQHSKIKWIADFRDPLTTVLRNHSEIEHVYLKQRRIKYEVVKYSDAIITASLAHKYIMHDIFKGKYFEKMHFIPTGLDDDFLTESKEAKENYIAYSGEYLIENGFYIFSVLNYYNLNYDEKLKIKIFGAKSINQQIVYQNIEDDKLIDNVEFIDHIPQKELYKKLIKAKATLLISEGRWWCSFAKMIDYIALQLPIIAQVPEISEANTQLLKANLGVFLTGDLKKDAQLLSNIANGLKSEPNIDFCKKYLASRQVSQFIEIFENL